MTSPTQRAASGLSWARDGADWPNRQYSRFVEAAGLRWHVQIAGQGPVLLLVHGTGASTHSWRALIPMLAEHFTVVAPDLPGHAFTRGASSRHLSLPGMAAALVGLLGALDYRPRLVVGHSAGAAVLVRMCTDRRIEPAGLISINGALLPIGGLAGRVFSPLAKILASGSALPRLFAWWASDAETVRRVIRQTGSKLDAEGLAFYTRLARDPAHTAGALGMMANWDLEPIGADLPRLPVPLVLVVGTSDGSVPPEDAAQVRRRCPSAIVERLRGLGHLAHEEKPDEVTQLVLRYAKTWAVA